MSTPPISIGITAVDQTSPAFASATAKMREFEVASAGSFGNAKGAARLLNAELDTGLNRTLVGVMANSKLLGPILQNAFPVLAAAGFAMVVADGAKRMSDWISNTFIFTDAMKELDKTLAGVNQNIQKYNDKTAQLTKQFDLIGLSGSEKTAVEIKQKQSEIDAVAAESRRLSDNMNNARNYGVVGGSSVGPDSQQYTKWAAALGEAQAHLKELNQESLNLNALYLFEKHQEAIRAAERYAQAVEHAASALSKLKDKAFASLPAMVDYAKKPDSAYISSALPEKFGDSIYQFGFSDEIRQLEPTLDQFNKHMEQLRAQVEYTKTAWHSFGYEIGDSLKQGILMGRSWSDVLKTVGVDLAQLIIKLTLLKDLQGASGTGGGLFGAIIGGIAGVRADGGPVSAGMSYLVGERGRPEIFTPGANGFVSPLSGGSSGTIVQNFDMRGSIVSTDVVTRAELAASEKRSVRQSLVAQREATLRR